MALKDFNEILKGRVDKFFGVLGKTTSILIASLFLIFSLGSLYGFFIAHSPDKVILLIIPPILGVIAYYSRGFAVAIAAILLLILIV
ncbi:MAG: hypothetical protein COT55_02505 [Candidatus Diapherotrites archaeon CG09_land_8_20_14_0_10_32_12]|nr:MAG: hypothetical protein COT55_02505 [Candidatus Diapherotrites archaeon CG09_land_8_20_14_0_10_32_12]